MTLPAFLLAYAESNLVWLGGKRFILPAVSVRWSFARVFTLTFAQVLAGLAVAGVLSLLFFRQPVGWIFWLLGWMSACQGIVGYGLMALCWNQRAAKLKADPNLPLRLSPARYPVFRWMLGLVYFVVLAVITPPAMVVTIQNIYGQMAWQREKARLVAQGERLTYREILGSEIPAGQNAGAAPVFAPFFDYAPGGVNGVPGDYLLRPESSNAVARIKDCLNLPATDLRQDPKDALTTPKENLAAWSFAYRKLAVSPGKEGPAWAAELKLPEPGDPVRDVLAGLRVADPVLAEICAAAARPRSQFPLHWDEGCLVFLSHLPVLKSVQQNLNLRCAAHLGAGELDAAFADATNALNVAELLREEPLLISQLVRMAQGAIATRTIWQGFAEHRWRDAQLAVFQERLGRVDFPAGLIRAFEGERAGGIVLVDNLIAGRDQLGTPGSGGGLRRAAMIVPLGVLRENQVALVRAHTDMLGYLRARVSAAPQAGFATPVLTQTGTVHQAKDRKEHLVEAGMRAVMRVENDRVERYSPFAILARMLTPALAKAETKAARPQTTVHLAITACALERHRLAHGSYPEKLDALAPAFLPKPLPDPMTGQPFRYRRTDDGWFQLYSVGEDGKDDGGVFRTKPKETIKDWPWPVPTRPEAGSLF